MNEPIPKGIPSSINPVIFDAELAGRFWLASDMKDGSQATVETTGFKQWLYAGFGYAWQVILPNGKKQWTSGIMGNCYIMRESTTNEISVSLEEIKENNRNLAIIADELSKAVN